MTKEPTWGSIGSNKVNQFICDNDDIDLRSRN